MRDPQDVPAGTAKKELDVKVKADPQAAALEAKKRAEAIELEEKLSREDANDVTQDELEDVGEKEFWAFLKASIANGVTANTLRHMDFESLLPEDKITPAMRAYLLKNQDLNPGRLKLVHSSHDKSLNPNPAKKTPPGILTLTNCNDIREIHLSNYIDIPALFAKYGQGKIKLEAMKLTGHWMLDDQGNPAPVLVFHASSGEDKKELRELERAFLQDVIEQLFNHPNFARAPRIRVLTDSQENAFQLTIDKKKLKAEKGRLVLDNIVGSVFDEYKRLKVSTFELAKFVTKKARGLFRHGKFMGLNMSSCQQREKDGEIVFDGKIWELEFERRQPGDNTPNSAVLIGYKTPLKSAVVDFTTEDSDNNDHSRVVKKNQGITIIGTGNMSVKPPKDFKNPTTVYKLDALDFFPDGSVALKDEVELNQIASTKDFYCITTQKCATIVLPADASQETSQAMANLHAVIRKALSLPADRDIRTLTQAEMVRFDNTDSDVGIELNNALNELLITQAAANDINNPLTRAWQDSIDEWSKTANFIKNQGYLQDSAKFNLTAEAARTKSNGETRTKKRNPINMLSELFPLQLLAGYALINGSKSETNDSMRLKQRFSAAKAFAKALIGGSKRVFMAVTEGSNEESQLSNAGELLAEMTQFTLQFYKMAQARVLKPQLTQQRPLNSQADVIERLTAEAARAEQQAMQMKEQAKMQQQVATEREALVVNLQQRLATAAATLQELELKARAAQNQEEEIQRLTGLLGENQGGLAKNQALEQENRRLGSQVDEIGQQNVAQLARADRAEEALRAQTALIDKMQEENARQLAEQRQLAQQAELQLQQLQQLQQQLEQAGGNFQPQVGNQPLQLTEESTQEQITTVISRTVQDLLKKPASTLTPMDQAKLVGLQHYLNATNIVQRPLKDRTASPEDHIQAETLRCQAGLHLWNFYEANGPDNRTAATTSLLNTCKLMEKRNCCQKLKAGLLAAVGIGIVLGSIAALVVSFGTLAPAVAGLGALGVVISVEALGTVYGVAAVGAFLGAAKVYSSYRGGLFGTKPETHTLASVIREDVREMQKAAVAL